ncbi:MAG: type IV pilus assembly protein PilM [Acidimicrobiales bacterium]
MESVTIGLDIGSSAIRAAEIVVSKDGKRSLRRYGQVGLPRGYVVDGEINNPVGVTEALRRLWAETGFKGSKVVLGVSGPRVFVRQAEVPAMSPEETRSSLRFGGQELIPVPMDDASFDFGFLGEPVKGPSGEGTQKVLLVAAHREVLQTYLDVLSAAGLKATVMDASQLALIRAVPEPPSGVATSPKVEVVVSIGAELTTVGVRQGGVPRFIRSLAVGGSKLTDCISEQMHLELAVAERLKRGEAAPEAQALTVQARKAMSSGIRDLAEEIRATIDFFVSQSNNGAIDKLLITGGTALTTGLAASIGGNLPVEVRLLDPLATLDCSALPYNQDQLRAISAGAATAVGLALWPTDAPLIRLSILPDEVLAARRAKRMSMLTLAGVGVAAALFAVGAVAEFSSVHQAQAAAKAEQAKVPLLTSEVGHLQALTSVHSQAQARAALVATALKGDVDWVRVLGQFAGVLPPQLSITSFSGNTSVPAVASGSTVPSSPAGVALVGTATFAVQGTGGLPSAAQWLSQLAGDPDFTNLTIGSITVKSNGGAVTFSSTAGLTPEAESTRSKGVTQ